MAYALYLIAAILAFALQTPLPAGAAASAWHETTGGKIRLVISENTAEGRPLKGALQIALEPGWKTYWRDPGAAGIPPQITFDPASGLGGVEIGFPPPQRFHDEYGAWAGYKTDTDFALTISRIDPVLPRMVEADVFVGICETICVPVQARLRVELTMVQTDAEAERVVAAAFAVLPHDATENFGLENGSLAGQTIAVTAQMPEPRGETALFIENSGGWYLGTPEISGRTGDSVTFSVPVTERPEENPEPPEFVYTLTNGDSAVWGFLGIQTEN